MRELSGPARHVSGARVVGERLRNSVLGLGLTPDARPSGAGCADLSIGIACSEPDPQAGRQSVVDAADRALYRAKAAGRDRVEI